MSIRTRLAREGREIYTTTDLKSLSLADLLACLTRSEELSRSLTAVFPTPKTLADADLVDLMETPGISWARAEQVKAAFELAARAAVVESESPVVLRKPAEVHALLSDRFRGLTKEVFLVICLSTRNRVLRIETVSEGTLNASLVHPREVFRPALLASAASILVCHNHPSGEPDPSEDDIAITKRLAETGEVLGIALLDHIIVAGERFCSLKESGHL